MKAGGGGSKAPAAAKAAKAASSTAQKAASEDAPAGDGAAVAVPSGPDPRLQAPKREPVTVRANATAAVRHLTYAGADD